MTPQHQQEWPGSPSHSSADFLATACVSYSKGCEACLLERENMKAVRMTANYNPGKTLAKHGAPLATKERVPLLSRGDHTA